MTDLGLSLRAGIAGVLVLALAAGPARGAVAYSAQRRVRIEGPGFRTPSWPAPALADWDGDGIPDLTLAHYAGPLWIYPRAADGSFREAFPLRVNRREKITGDSGLCVTDWNADGLFDFLLGEGREVALYLNTGTRQMPCFEDGSLPGFEPLKQGAKLEAGGAVLALSTPISGLDVADWDGDGLPDLLVGEQAGKVWWYRNAGHPGRPALVAPVLLDAQGQSILGDTHFACPAVADLDGDGRNDLAVASYAKGIQGYLGRGAPGQPVLVPLPGEAPPPPLMLLSRARILLADWNGDGRPDLLAGDRVGELHVAFNRSQSADASVTRPVRVRFDVPQRIAGRDFSCRRFLTASFADLDGDGAEDLVAGSHNRLLHFYLRSGPPGPPRFEQPALPVSGATPHPRDMGLTGLDQPLRSLQPYPCDWNGDGVPDLVFGSESGAVVLLQNFGTRRRFEFDMRRRSGFNATLLHVDAAGWTVPLVADLDRDGVPDLLIGNGAGELLFLRNNGATHWPRFETPRPLMAAGAALRVSGAAAPFLTDWTGDGLPDLLVGTGAGRIHVFAGTPAWDAFADRGFLELDGTPLRIRERARPWVLDWNRDGVPDLLVIEPGDLLICYPGVTDVRS